MLRRISLAAAVPLLAIALAGCSTSPVSVVEVDPADQVPTIVEPTPTASESPTASPSPTPTETDESSQRLTCDGKDATIVTDDDKVEGTSGNDVIVLRGLGNIVVSTGNGDDAVCVFTGSIETPKSVTVFAGAGNDRFYGSDGTDVFFGGAGKDEANLYGGDDTLIGGADADKLRGGAGTDLVRGGDGNDVLYAGDGNDTIIGDAGEDSLFGDAGSDVFYLDKADNNQTDANEDDTPKPTKTLAQLEAELVAILTSSASTNGWTLTQGSGEYAGLVIAKDSNGTLVAATPGKK